nr:MAG TPA: RNA polymerase sigma-70 factor [Caudoviricetes sp.]
MDKSLDVSALSPGFEEVYAKYRTYFVRIAMSYVRDRMAAEDLVTDSFLKVWERRKETTPQHLPSYLLAVLKRNCLNWLRDRSIHIRAHQTLQQTEQRIVNERIVHLESGSPPKN